MRRWSILKRKKEKGILLGGVWEKRRKKSKLIGSMVGLKMDESWM